jgi:hypothetical protein
MEVCIPPSLRGYTVNYTDERSQDKAISRPLAGDLGDRLDAQYIYLITDWELLTIFTGRKYCLTEPG